MNPNPLTDVDKRRLELEEDKDRRSSRITLIVATVGVLGTLLGMFAEGTSRRASRASSFYMGAEPKLVHRHPTSIPVLPSKAKVLESDWGWCKKHDIDVCRYAPYLLVDTVSISHPEWRGLFSANQDGSPQTSRSHADRHHRRTNKDHCPRGGVSGKGQAKRR